MKKAKRLLSVAFGIIFALSSYNSEHGYNNYSSNGSYEHAHELEHHDEHDHNHGNESLDTNDDINLGNNKLGISVLSKSKTKAGEDGIKFGVHTMDTSSTDDGYGSIELQANYSPEGCLKDSVWSVSDTSALKITPNAIDSSICVVEALKEFDGEVTISVKSKFFSDICATLKATYVGGFNIEVISGSISLNATRKCAHSSTTITESPNSKSNLSNYFKVKYKGSYLSESELYKYINNGDLIVSCTGDLTFNNNSNAPYFLMKDLTASSSAGSKVIGATIKVKEDESKNGSISGTSTMTIGDWSTLTGSKKVQSTCFGTIKQYDNGSYSYYCSSCNETSSYSYYGNTCGKLISSAVYCSGTSELKTSATYGCSNCSRTGSFSGTCGKLLSSSTSYYCASCKKSYASNVSSCTAEVSYTYYACNKCDKTYSSSGVTCGVITSDYYYCTSCGETYTSNVSSCTKSTTSTCGGSKIVYTSSTCGGSIGYYAPYWRCTKCSTSYGTSKPSITSCTQITYTYRCGTCGTTYSTGSGFCTSSKTTTCGGTIKYKSTSCGGTSIPKSGTKVCGGAITSSTIRNYCSGTCEEKTSATYGCSNCSRTGSFSGTCGKLISSAVYCSGTITRKWVSSYIYKCATCNRVASSYELNSTCNNVSYSNEDYDYCSVCNKEL